MENIRITINEQKEFFGSGETVNVAYRIASLRKLQKTIITYEKEILDALKSDLGKSRFEAYMCEYGMVLQNLSYTLSHIKRWTKHRYVKSPISNFPAKSMILEEPYGVVLIISPWNYPFLLSLEPLIGAIAAGNCVIVKPSEFSSSTSQVITHIIEESFDNKHVAIIQGDRFVSEKLLEQPFDYIFFTGSVGVGKTVMQQAARLLTPVTLELGGKSPTIVERSANLPLSARRIVFGKFLNCGQTCIAPDYILVEECVHDELIRLLKAEIQTMYGDALQNKDYGKIVNDKHFTRLCGLIDPSKLVYGGRTSVETQQIEPTLLDNVLPSDAVMQEEIFGPILPVLTVKDMDEAIRFVRHGEKPLALYLFTTNKKVEQRVMQSVSFGGGCVNDTIMHVASSHLPFGGIGNSGMGHYHGEYTFHTFSHPKPIIRKSNWLDITLRYPPYSSIKERLLRFFLN